MKKKRSLLILATLLILLVGCSNDQKNNRNGSEKVELRVSAAASLTDVLGDFKKAFEKSHPDITLTFMFGSSGKLASQIEQGAPSDLFLSASKVDMDELEGKDFIDNATRTDFTENALVLIANQDKKEPISHFEDINPSKLDHLVIGDPGSVPAGRYSKEVLEKLELWEPLQDKLVYASDVRQVLTQVERGNADYGIVYSSDAFISNDVNTVAKAEPNWHEPIVYPGAVLKSTEHPEEAQIFLDELLGDQGQEILANHGFQ